MKKHIIVGIICGLGMGICGVDNAWSACSALGLMCNATLTNPYGNCCPGLECRTTSNIPVGPGICSECEECGTCPALTDWTSTGTGYIKRSSQRCNCGRCMVLSTSYACAAGYYGTSTDGATGCTRCPAYPGGYGTSNIQSDVRTKCYIPVNATGSDNSGTYKYTDKCNYTE